MIVNSTPSISTDDVWITTDPPAEYHPSIYLSVTNSVGPPAHQRKTGIRFTNITIPQGAVIQSVTLTVVCFATRSADITIRITGEAEDNPNTFASRADYLSRPRTSNYYDWVAPAMVLDNEYSVGPGTELKSIIQEIIDREGWSSGNALTLFLEWQSGVADCSRHFYSYDDSPEVKLPKLSITYAIRYSKTISSKANIRASKTQTLTAKANIRSAISKSVDVKSNIKAAVIRTIDVRAWIGLIKLIEAKAAIKRLDVTKTIQVKGQIGRTETYTIQTKSCLHATAWRTIEVKGNIFKIAVIGKPVFGSATLPFPDYADITPIWEAAENIALMGKTRRNVMARKYKYTLRWNTMSVLDYNNLEIITNTLESAQFIYEKWPQSRLGINCVGSLSPRRLEVGSGDSAYFSSVTLILTEVDNRI